MAVVVHHLRLYVKTDLFAVPFSLVKGFNGVNFKYFEYVCVFVVNDAANLGICQSSIDAQILQGARRYFKESAYFSAFQPIFFLKDSW